MKGDFKAQLDEAVVEASRRRFTSSSCSWVIGSPKPLTVFAYAETMTPVPDFGVQYVFPSTIHLLLGAASELKIDSSWPLTIIGFLSRG